MSILLAQITLFRVYGSCRDLLLRYAYITRELAPHPGLKYVAFGQVTVRRGDDA
jgi:hypothetical protein